MATTIADAYVQIIPSADGISGQLQSVLGSEASAAGSAASGNFGTAFQKGIGTAMTVGATGFGVFTMAVTAGTTALTKGISSLATYTDHIDKQSQKMNMSTTEYQEWSAVMEHCGTSIDTMQTSMKTLSSAVETGSNAFGQLGLDMEEIQSMDSEELFSATITALQNVDDETERTYLASQLLGRGATELGALLNTSAEDTEAMKERVAELGGVLSEDAVKAGAAFKDSLQDMSTAFTGLKNNMLVEFLPSVTTIMDGLTEIFAGNSSDGLGIVKEGVESFITNLTDLIPRINEVGGSIVSSLIEALTENSSAILSSGAEVIVQIATSITQNLPVLAQSASDIFFQLVDSFLELLPTLADTGLTILENLMNGIGENLDTLIPTVVSVVLEITNTLIEHIPDLIDAGLTIFLGLVEGITQAIPVIVEYLPTLVESIIEALTEAVPLICDAGITLMTAIVEDLPTIIETVTEAIPEIVDSIVDFLSGDGLTSMIDAGVQLFCAIVTNLPTIITTIVAAIPKIVNSLVQALAGREGDIEQAGENLLTALGDGIVAMAMSLNDATMSVIGEILSAVTTKASEWTAVYQNLITSLWNGFKSKVGEVTSGMTTWATNIINAVKSKFGIASPSKVFTEIGGYLAEGLEAGWNNEIKEVQKSISDDMNFTGSISYTTASATPTQTNYDGMKLVVHDYIDLGDTRLKEIVSEYTIQQIGNETRALRVSQGGVYGI